MALYAYLLLPESVRLIASPRSVSSLSIFMRRLSRRYAVWYNRAHSHTGPVWQGRFHSSVLEPASLQKLTLYMEGLPVREGFVKRPEQYVWSSYAHHAGFRTDPFLTEPDAGDESRALRDAACRAYRELFNMESLQPFGEEAEWKTRRGWPIGSAPFVDSLPVSEERKRAARGRGRPRREGIKADGNRNL